VTNKYNQFVQQQMKANKPDEEKLVELGGLIRINYELIVHREPILLFDKKDGHLIKTAFAITEDEYHSYITHVPDLLLYVRNQMWIFEIDGWIHNVKHRVMMKDERRNECYERAKLNFHVINELEILLKLGKKTNKPAKASEIFDEMRPLLDKILKQQGL